MNLMVCGTDDIVGNLNLVSQFLQLANVTGRQVQSAVKALQVGLKMWETADTKPFVVLMPKTSEILNMVSTASSMSDVSGEPIQRFKAHLQRFAKRSSAGIQRRKKRSEVEDVIKVLALS